MKKKIIVIGSGAWGTALANLLAKNSNRVLLSSDNVDVVAEINDSQRNHNFLPDVILHKKLKAIYGFAAEIFDADLVFIVTPSSAAINVFNEINKVKVNPKCGFIICSKGFEGESALLLTDSFEKVVGNNNYAVLSGPNFAIEVAKEMPTITTIASKNKKLANRVIKALSNDYFKATYFKDPRSAEICGIVKNIMAIGCGVIDGLGLGVNTKSALIMQGIYEIQILSKALKASSDVTTAAGFGDIFLTCSSTKSRNNSLGVEIAGGVAYNSQGHTTYEGAVSALILDKLAKKLNLNLPLCQTISNILQNNFTSAQIKEKIIKAIL